MCLDSLLIDKQVEISVSDIAGCNFITGLDVFFWDENQDFELRIIRNIRIGNTGMIGPR